MVLLYPMLLQRKGFELRMRSHVLGVNYDRKAKRATGDYHLAHASAQEAEQALAAVVRVYRETAQKAYVAAHQPELLEEVERQEWRYSHATTDHIHADAKQKRDLARDAYNKAVYAAPWTSNGTS